MPANFTMNTEDFRREFGRIIHILPEDLKKGLFKAGAELIDDANRVEPKTPKKEGTLKGSWQIQAEAKGGENYEIWAGFNEEYASRVHEMVDPGVHWSEPGSGAKYLESKLTMFGKKYLDIATRSMRGEE